MDNPKVMITIEENDEGQVGIKTEFIPNIDLRSSASNPSCHQVAIRMLDAAIDMSDDPERAMREMRFGERDGIDDDI